MTDLSPLAISLKVSFSATILTILVGLPAAYLLARKKIPFRPIWEGITLLPMVLPPTVMGYYLLVAFGKTNPFGRTFHALTGFDLVFTWQGASVAACIVSIPMFIRTAQVGIASVGRDYLDAAREMGASEFQTFRWIVAPIAMPSLLAGLGLAFARALGDFGATLMIAGNIPGLTRTMPLAVYDAVSSGDDRTALFYVIMLSVVCMVAAVTASQLTRPHT